MSSCLCNKREAVEFFSPLSCYFLVNDALNSPTFTCLSYLLISPSLSTYPSFSIWLSFFNPSFPYFFSFRFSHSALFFQYSFIMEIVKRKVETFFRESPHTSPTVILQLQFRCLLHHVSSIPPSANYLNILNTPGSASKIYILCC